MNWDEKAHKAAVSELLKASQDASHAGRIPSIQAPFVAAAKWQRDQLRTDEAVERVANVILEDRDGETLEQHMKTCLRPDTCAVLDWCTCLARAAITALLGEDA